MAKAKPKGEMVLVSNSGGVLLYSRALEARGGFRIGYRDTKGRVAYEGGSDDDESDDTDEPVAASGAPPRRKAPAVGDSNIE